jgi:hypothetical protein
MSTVNYPFTGLERKSMTFSPVLDGNGLHLPDEVEHRRAALVSADHQQRRQPVLNTAVVGSTSSGG